MSALRAAILKETDYDTLMRLAEIAEADAQEAQESRVLALVRADQMVRDRPEVSIAEAALILGKIERIA